MDFFDENYPRLSRLYIDYINSDEYAKHPIVEYAELKANQAIDNAMIQLKQGNENRAYDTFVSGAVTYEQSGFILGFSFAMNLIRESISDKTQISTNKI